VMLPDKDVLAGTGNLTGGRAVMRYTLFRQPNFRLRLDASDNLDALKMQGRRHVSGTGERAVIVESLPSGDMEKVWDSDNDWWKRGSLTKEG